MKLLVWKFKYDDIYYDISTKAKEEAAYRAMFSELDVEFEVYAELTDTDLKEAEDELAELLKYKAEADEKKLSQFLADNLHRAFADIPSRESYVRGLKKQVALYKKAKAGDYAAIRELLNYRSKEDYEYETFRIVETTEPEITTKKVSTSY